MATVLAVARFLGTLLMVLGVPFLFLVYVIASVASVHPRTTWLDGYRDIPPPVGGQSVTLAWSSGELPEPLDAPDFIPLDAATPTASN